MMDQPDQPKRTDLPRAADEGNVPSKQADALRALEFAPSALPAGHREPAAGILIAAVVALLLALGPLAGWSWFGGPGLLMAGAAYCAFLYFAADRCQLRGYHAAAGFLGAAAALMLPLALFGLERTIGFLSATSLPRGLGALLREPAFTIDLAALLALALSAWRFPFPPVAALVTGAAWLIAMDLAPFAFDSATTWNERALLSAAIGPCAIVAGLLVERRARGDYSGWFYAAGVVALHGGLMPIQPSSHAAMLLLPFVEASLVATGLILGRRIFAVLGALGFAGAAGEVLRQRVDRRALLACEVGVALAVLAGAVGYLRYEGRLAGRLRRLIPRALRRRLPPLPESPP